MNVTLYIPATIKLKVSANTGLGDGGFVRDILPATLIASVGLLLVPGPSVTTESAKKGISGTEWD